MLTARWLTPKSYHLRSGIHRWFLGVGRPEEEAKRNKGDKRQRLPPSCSSLMLTVNNSLKWEIPEVDMIDQKLKMFCEEFISTPTQLRPADLLPSYDRMIFLLTWWRGLLPLHLLCSSGQWGQGKVPTPSYRLNKTKQKTKISWDRQRERLFKGRNGQNPGFLTTRCL